MFAFILLLRVMGDFHNPLPLQKSVLTSYDKQLPLATSNVGTGCSVRTALYATPLLSFRNSS